MGWLATHGAYALACRLRQVHCRRNREVGQGGQVRGYQGGVICFTALPRCKCRLLARIGAKPFLLECRRGAVSSYMQVQENLPLWSRCTKHGYPSLSRAWQSHLHRQELSLFPGGQLL